MQINLRTTNVFAVGLYLFFGVLLLQNMAVLMLLATGLDVPITIFSVVNAALLFSLACLMLLRRDLYTTLWADKKLALVIGAVGIVSLLRGGGLGYLAGELRFYLSPIAFFLIGRVAAPFLTERQIARFVVFVATLYVVVGFIFVAIDRNLLMDYGLRAFFHQKLAGLGRSDETFNDLPINFYFFREGQKEIYRAFGAFFDPLVTAFFGAALFFYIYETHRRRLAKYAGLLTVLVGFMILLTMTRAIILVVVLVLIIGLLFKRGIASLPIWLAVTSAGLAIVAVALNLNTLLASLDPSSIGHLNAYLNINATTGLIGAPPEPDAPRGNESLYLTIFLELGVIVTGVIAVWITSLYRGLLRHYDEPYMRPALEAMFVYMLASFTTEHWFVFTSGALFWLLLGNVTKLSEMRHATAHLNPLHSL